jgi:hypothetical protein
MPAPEARAGSWEDVLHRAGEEDNFPLLPDVQNKDEFLEMRGHRAIGVVYRPDYESYGNYVPAVLPRRCDAFFSTWTRQRPCARSSRSRR